MDINKIRKQLTSNVNVGAVARGRINSGNTDVTNKGPTSSNEGASKPPPAPVQSSTSNATNKTGSTGCHLRLGGLSKYLLEKVQSNDSGLDLSPATLQTLVNPLRSSGSSTSSLHGRSLFQSPATPSDELPLVKSKTEPVPPTPVVSRSVLAEHSHNSSETTMIEKTLTDDSTDKNVSKVKKNGLDELIGHSVNAKEPSEIVHQNTHPYHHPEPLTAKPVAVNRDDVTPSGPFSIFYQRDKSESHISHLNNENTDPALNSFGSRHTTANNSIRIPSADVAAVIPQVPNTSDHHFKKAPIANTPKPKTKKKFHLPESSKKPTGWKFLSQHVQGREFLIINQLGKGGCGEVSLVIEKDTRKLFALKVVHLNGIDDAMIQECINEVEMLIELKGTDLVVEIQSWEFNQSEKTMKIVMEHGQCDLNRSILKSTQPSLLKLKSIWERLLIIVETIHRRGIVHADLKPANFVWVGDNLKIIDFGIASRLQCDLTSIAMANPKGTLNFVSPEIIQLDACGRSKLSPKSDVWGLGCILYLMVYGRTPFDHITHPVTKMNAILKGDVLYPTLPPHLQNSGVITVLKLCFQTDYKRRPSAGDLLLHPFVRS